MGLSAGEEEGGEEGSREEVGEVVVVVVEAGVEAEVEAEVVDLGVMVCKVRIAGLQLGDSSSSLSSVMATILLGLLEFARSLALYVGIEALPTFPDLGVA